MSGTTRVDGCVSWMRQAVAAAVRQRNTAVEELEEGTAEKTLVIERLRARVAAGEEVERP